MINEQSNRGGGNSSTLSLISKNKELEEKQEIQSQKILFKYTQITFNDGAAILNYSDWGVRSDGIAYVFIQERYSNSSIIPTQYIYQLTSKTLNIYGRTYVDGKIALATGNRGLDLLFVYI